MSEERLKQYTASAGKISSAIQSIIRSDGWMIFLALYKRKKREIMDRDDYATIEEFKADRKAIEIVDGILDEFNGWIEDAEAAAVLLAGLTGEESTPDRGIMLIEAAEGGSMEG